MTSSLLTIGSSALAAAQGSLATVSHNIANANTAGYSRQQAQLATAGAQYTGSGFFGKGVDIASVRRDYDQFLTATVQSAGSTSAADAARADGLKALDALFGNPDLGIGAAMDSFLSAAGDLANRPADLATRQVFVAQAGQAAQRITSIGQQVQDLLTQADARIAPQAAQANDQLATIAKLNAQIVQAQGQGQPPNDLLDQRDTALQALGALLSVQSVAQDDGSLALFTQGGAPLLVGAQRSTLSAVADPADASRHALQLTVGKVSQTLDAAALGGGSLAGTLRLRDQDLSSALDQVGRIAQVVATAVNGQQALGVDMDGQPGAPLFAAPAPVARAFSSNASSAAASASIVDASALVASDYDVQWDGSAWQVTRLSDGQVQSAATLPATIDGLQLAVSGAPATGDRWRVSPFAAAATGLAVKPVSARQVATAFAVTVQASATNTGGVTASGFQVVRASPDNTRPVTLTFNNPPTTFNVTGLAGGNLANVPYTAGQRVPAAPADYDGWSLVLDGTPAPGDSFSVGATTARGADNRNALALAALGQSALIGGATLDESYAALIGDVGSRTQSAQAGADVSAQLKDEAVARQQAVSGVDLDQEAADMLRFQQAYQASARVIQASQTVFEALLAAVGN